MNWTCFTSAFSFFSLPFGTCPATENMHFPRLVHAVSSREAGPAVFMTRRETSLILIYLLFPFTVTLHWASSSPNMSQLTLRFEDSICIALWSVTQRPSWDVWEKWAENHHVGMPYHTRIHGLRKDKAPLKTSSPTKSMMMMMIELTFLSNSYVPDSF